MSRRRRKYIADAPHLCRQRGKQKFWTGWIEGEEVSLGTADAREAQRKLDTLAADRGRAAHGAPAAPPPKLTELTLLYAQHCRPPKYSSRTASSYMNRITNFVEWAESVRIITTAHVNYQAMSKFVRARTAHGVGAATINRDRIAISSMFGFAKREGLIASNPFRSEDFRELKLREPRPKPNAITLSPTQVDLFLDTADTMSPTVLAAMFRLTAGSGVRIDEARHLDTADVRIVDAVAGTAELTITPKPGWTTKSYRYRMIPITTRTAAAVLAFVKARPKQAIDDKTVWDEMKRVRDKAKLPHFSMHDLRRAWASAVHHNGASLKQVSVWLGHAEVQTTERYIRVFGMETTGHEFLPR